MIRFSAALVAVAIGVLIGGIATSELSLVYIAIVVSAVALVALAIGVVLKREELFGEGQGLVPATAGVGPVLPARAGGNQDKVVAATHVAPPPPSAGAAAGYAPAVGNTAVSNTAFGRSAPPPSPTAAAPSVPRTAPAGQGRPGDPGAANPVPPWEGHVAPGAWPRPPLAADWMSTGQGDRTASDSAATVGRTPSARQDTAPPVPQSGWRRPDEDAQAAETAPRPWAPRSAPPAPVSPPDVKPASESGSAAPSWFDKLGGRASTVEPTSASGTEATSAAPTVSTPTVSTPTSAPPPVPGGKASAGTESGDPVPSGTVAGDVVPGNTGADGDDDDWPTRYSWLDDDSDESGEAAEETREADADTADTVADATAAAVTAAAETVAAPTADAGTPDESAADVAEADQAEEPDAHIIAFPGPAATPAPATGADPHNGRADEANADGAEADGRTETDSPATAGADTGSDASAEAAAVTVVPGVPRYHRPDCVLIRFMPDGDVQKLSVAEAKGAGCTPCAACQPVG